MRSSISFACLTSSTARKELLLSSRVVIAVPRQIGPTRPSVVPHLISTRVEEQRSASPLFLPLLCMLKRCRVVSAHLKRSPVLPFFSLLSDLTPRPEGTTARGLKLALGIRWNVLDHYRSWIRAQPISAGHLVHSRAYTASTYFPNLSPSDLKSTSGKMVLNDIERLSDVVKVGLNQRQVHNAASR